MGPARNFTESLTPDPELENSQGQKQTPEPEIGYVSSTPVSRRLNANRRCPQWAKTGIGLFAHGCRCVTHVHDLHRREPAERKVETPVDPARPETDERPYSKTSLPQLFSQLRGADEFRRIVRAARQ